jgi:hypothetical protein
VSVGELFSLATSTHTVGHAAFAFSPFRLRRRGGIANIQSELSGARQLRTSVCCGPLPLQRPLHSAQCFASEVASASRVIPYGRTHSGRSRSIALHTRGTVLSCPLTRLSYALLEVAAQKRSSELLGAENSGFRGTLDAAPSSR